MHATIRLTLILINIRSSKRRFNVRPRGDAGGLSREYVLVSPACRKKMGQTLYSLSR